MSKTSNSQDLFDYMSSSEFDPRIEHINAEMQKFKEQLDETENKISEINLQIYSISQNPLLSESQKDNEDLPQDSSEPEVAKEINEELYVGRNFDVRKSHNFLSIKAWFKNIVFMLLNCFQANKKDKVEELIETPTNISMKVDLAIDRSSLYEELQSKNNLISLLSSLEKTIQEKTLHRNYLTFKYVMNYHQFHQLNDQIHFALLNEFNYKFESAIEFLKFFCDKENSFSNYYVSQQELQSFTSSYCLFFGYSRGDEIIPDALKEVQHYVNKSIIVAKNKEILFTKIDHFNYMIDYCRIHENQILKITKDEIKLVDEIKDNIHKYIKNDASLSQDDYKLFSNYIFIHNKLLDLGKINHDNGIMIIAEKLQSLKPKENPVISHSGNQTNDVTVSRKNVRAMRNLFEKKGNTSEEQPRYKPAKPQSQSTNLQRQKSDSRDVYL